jgi:hypothetical protein
MRTALKAAIESYNAVQDLPLQTVDERVAIGKQIPPLIKEIKKLLKTNGDLFMKRFQKTEPAFYYEYEQSRKIVEPKVNHTELKGVVVSGADGSYALRVEPGTYSVPPCGKTGTCREGGCGINAGVNAFVGTRLLRVR